VVQAAAKIVIEPIFEADFQPCSYGFRPKKSATQALEAIRAAGNRGQNFVAEREGCEADHRGTDTRTSRLGQLLPDGESRPGVQ
jgi:hypothetical protein